MNNVCFIKQCYYKYIEEVSLNQIVLNGGWRNVVEDNGLKAEVDCVEVWSFRADSKMCFAFDVKRQLQD